MKNLRRTWTVMSLCLLALSLGCGGAGSNEDQASGEPAQSGFFASARYSLPENSVVQVRLGTSVASGSATLGQPVRGDVATDVVAGGHVVIPAGSQVTGTVTAVKPAKRFGGQAMIAVGFDSVTLPNGDRVPIEGGMAAYADSEKAKDTGAIVGGTVGGAILGKVIGKDTKDAVTGAVIGGGVGTAIASRKGDEAHLPAGTSAKVQTRRALELPAV
ncbi:MAG: glycine zipper 2TM domain-containing protein [Candidatus Polarisedimenticolia bacterium]